LDALHNNREFKREPRLFERASGMHYWTPTGARFWMAAPGFHHARGSLRAEIATAVAKQLQTLDFTPSFMRCHPGAFALADGVARSPRRVSITSSSATPDPRRSTRR